MNQKISPPSQKLDGLFLLALSMAVFFVGVTEFMLSSMLAAGAGVPHHYQRRRLADLQLRVLLCDRRAVAGLLLRPHATQEAAAARPGPLRGRYSGHRHRPDPEIAVVLRVIGGIASAIIIPTTFALVAEVVAPQRQAGAMGQVMLGMTLGIAAGPALAGLLSDFFGWAAPFLMVSCGCVLVFLMARQRLPCKPWHRAPRAMRWAGAGNGASSGH